MNRNVKCVLIGFFVLMFVGCVYADALPFSGEVVQLTGTQTEDIVWDENNFGGFCYDINGNVSTETLTIAAGTLTGPDIDRIIDVGNLTYTTSPIWREYELHKNLGLTVDGDARCDCDSGYWTEFWMGERYVAIDGNADKLAKPLVEFNSTDTRTLVTGEKWDLGGGFAFEAKQVDMEGKKVLFCLYKNGKELDIEVIGTGNSGLQERVYTYTEDVGSDDNIQIFSCYVSAVFRGTCSNLVQVKYVFLIDNDAIEIDTGDTYGTNGTVEVMTASSSGVALENDVPIDLNSSTTTPIMGNLSFKTSDNTSAIEFYPHLIRDEPPVLSDGGGFVLDDCQIGSAWNLSENYSIAAKDIALDGDKARIVLLKNGAMVDEVLLTEEFRAPVYSDSHYSYVKNGTDIINATLKAAFRGNDSNVVELTEVYQRSEVDGSTVIDNESYLFKSVDPVGILWYLADGYVLTMKDVSFNGDEVWLELSKNGVVVKEKILNESSTFAYASDIGGINCMVDRVFQCCEANAVKLVNVSQYSDTNGTALIVDGSHFYRSADPGGMPWELMDGYVLTMKDVDVGGDEVWLELLRDGIILKEDILESGDLFEYRNGLESLDCVVEAVFKGCWADVVKLRNVSQYSNTSAQLIDNQSKTYVTAYPPVVDIWERWEGYSLALKDIGLNGDKVWLSLSKDGVVVKDAIIDSRKCDEDRLFKHYNSTCALLFSTYVDAVFRCTATCIVQLKRTTQYSEMDGRLFIEPSTESWQLEEGYYLTAQEVYWNDSVWLQLSKNDKLVDEGLFYNNSSFSLQNDTAGHTIVSGMISGSYWDYDYVQLTAVTQYYEANGTVLATWQTKTLNTSLWSFKNDKKTLSIPPRFPKTLTVDDSGGADFTSIRAATNRAIPGDTIYVHAGTYVGNVRVYKRLTLIGEGADVVTVIASSAEDPVFDVTADYVNISGFTVTGANDEYHTPNPPAGIYLGGVDHCNISGNNVYGNHYGILLWYSSNNTLQNNNASNNRYGIGMSSSNNNTLQNNTMSGNKYNFGVSGRSLSHYTQNIDPSNTVDRKPIYYWVDYEDMQIPGDAGFVGVVGSTNITVRDLTLTKNQEGVLFAHTKNSRIENVTASDNSDGIYLYSSSNNTLTNSTSNSNDYGILLKYSSDNTLTNNTANSNRLRGFGIYLSSSSNNMLTGNTASNNRRGIHLRYSSNNTLAKNNCSNNNAGIHLSSSNNNTLTSNNASNNHYGIYLYRYSSNNALSDNIASSNWCGIYPELSDNNELTKNNASSNDWGIYLDRSSNNDLTGNIMSENDHNFGVHGNRLSHFIQNIDASNLVDKKPIYYWVAKRNLQIPDDAGFVGVVNSTNITVKELTLTNNSAGVLFAYTNNSRIENVTVSNNGDGIIMDCSSNNTLVGNNASNNYYGIVLSSSGNNTLTGNTASNNYYGSYPYGIYAWFSSGISLSSSSNNIISNNIANSNHRHGFYLGYSSNNNTLTNNIVLGNDYYGINLQYSSNNILYRNNLINNTQNAYDTGTNQWDSDYDGNYYSDYYGNDTNTDGIGDDPHPIPGGSSVDHYPLMQPWTATASQKGDLNGDNRITPADAAIALAFAAGGGSASCDATTLDAADVSGDGRVTSLDALMILQAAGGWTENEEPPISNIDVDSIGGWRGGSNSSAGDMDTFSEELYCMDIRCSLKCGSDPADMSQTVITIGDGMTVNDMRYIYGEINTTDGIDAPRLADDVNKVGTYFRLEVRDGAADGKCPLYYFQKAYPDAYESDNVVYSSTGTDPNNRIGIKRDGVYFARCDKFYIIDEIWDVDNSFTKDNPVMNTGDLVKIILFTGPEYLDNDLDVTVIHYNETSIDANELANALTADGWVIYGTDQCGWCTKQKEEFGDAFENITYINCMNERQKCSDAGVQGIPCWGSPNGTLHTGYRNLTGLLGLLNSYRAAHLTAIHNNETMGESSLTIDARSSVSVQITSEGDGSATTVDFVTPCSYGTYAYVDLYP